MSDPIALDLWNVGTWANNSRAGAQTGEDGYVDSIYVGDMNGVFYGIKLNFDPLQTLSSSGQNYGIYVDLWRTKPIPVNSTTTVDLRYRFVSFLAPAHNDCACGQLGA